jgi:methyltransferase (TIGR00027 family)
MNDQRASSTALLIARSLLLAEATPHLHPLVTASSAALTRRLLEIASPGSHFDFFLRHRFTRRLLLTLERLTLPGIFLHYLVRKQRIASLATAALPSHGRQLVVLGAGLDTLAWRQSREGNAVSFELDHPATQTIKQRCFQGDPLPTPHLIPADLAQKSPAVLLRSAPGFDFDRRSFFIAEGLLMYFAPTRVSALLTEIADHTAAGSHLIFTFMETRPGQPLGFHNASPVINAWLRHRQEPFRWGLERTKVASFARRHGWQLEYLSSTDELRATVLANHRLEHAPLAVGESIALLVKPRAP